MNISSVKCKNISNDIIKEVKYEICFQSINDTLEDEIIVLFEAK